MLIRGPSQRVISYSYYQGLDNIPIDMDHFFQGIENNMVEISNLYPGYVMRVYTNIRHALWSMV